MTNLTWHSRIKLSRQRPAFFLGSQSGNLLPNSIRAPLELVFGTESFLNPTKGFLSLSPCQYHWIFRCGALRSEISKVINWEECDVLWDAISDSWEKVREMHGKWTAPFKGNADPLTWFSCNLWFAEQGILAVRNQLGIWWQLYQSGWPITPPMLAEGIDSDIGLMLAASLSKNWFKDLPFTREAAEARIPKEIKPYIELSWHDQDTLFSGRRFGFKLSAALLNKWLIYNE